MDDPHEVVQSPGFPVLIETDISSPTSYPGPYCPQTYDCSISGYVSFDIGRALSYVTITSSGLSCLGSILVIATFLLLTLKDMRTVAQKIVTLLAIANLITAIGYILGSINCNFLVHFDETDTMIIHADTHVCYVFGTLCRTQVSRSGRQQKKSHTPRGEIS